MTTSNNQLNSQNQPIITAVQMNSQQDIDKNMLIASNAIKEAKQTGAALVVLPENVASMGKQKQTAERFDQLANQFANLAKEHQLYLVAGTLPCLYRPDGNKVADDKLRQVSLLFAPDGSQIARYDKIHLFRALVDDSHGSYDEAHTFEAGTELTVAPIELDGHTFKLGMMVCFDLRFPKMAQSLRQLGADILTAPSAFTYQTGKANWSLLLQSRALDSQCLLIGAGQGGEHQYNTNQHKNQPKKRPDNQTQDVSTRETWGHTGIAGCDGTMLAQYDSHLFDHSSKEKGYKLVNTRFDSEYQHNQRKRLPIFNCHRLV